MLEKRFLSLSVSFSTCSLPDFLKSVSLINILLGVVPLRALCFLDGGVHETGNGGVTQGMCLDCIPISVNSGLSGSKAQAEDNRQ